MLLEGASLPGLAALALVADGDATVESTATKYAIRRSITSPPGAREQVAFYHRRRPGARRRRGDGQRAAPARMARAARVDARRAHSRWSRASGNEAIDRLINRNLLFAYFYAVGRALDDAQYYLVRTRAPWNGHGVTVRDWDALTWTIPAVQLADPPLARELLLRMCELHGYAPGRGVHYLDGTLFEPGFALEGVAGYAIAADRYIRDTGDDRVVDEPVLADTLYLAADDLDARRDKRIPLYSTEVSPSGDPAPHPFTLHANAVAAQALDVLAAHARRRDRARTPGSRRGARGDPTGISSSKSAGKSTFASSIDLAGATSMADDPSASAFWLPIYEAVRATRLDVPPHREGHRRHAALVVAAVRAAHRPRRGGNVLQWLRRAPLDGGSRGGGCRCRRARRWRMAATRRCRDCSRGRRGTR